MPLPPEATAAWNALTSVLRGEDGTGMWAWTVAAAAVGALLGFLLGHIGSARRVKTALKRSRAVLGGLAAEQVAPWLPEFPCNPADARFIGKPVDFVAFPGAAEGHEVREVLFIEVKTGQATLSGREKDIRRAVGQGRVRYVVYRPPPTRNGD